MRILAEGKKGVTGSATTSLRTSKSHPSVLPSSAVRGQMISANNRAKESALVGDVGKVAKKIQKGSRERKKSMVLNWFRLPPKGSWVPSARAVRFVDILINSLVS